MRIIRNLLFITLPVLVVSLVAAELILRKFFPVDDPFERFKNRYTNSFIPSEMPHNVKYRLTSNEGLSGMDTAMTYSTNNVGFRGDSIIVPKPVDETRIFIIGGSTAQCLYIDDSKSLDRVLQDELRQQLPGKNIKVFAAAKSGDASDEHIAMLGHRIIHMQPDLVILFSGINDLRKTIQRYDYLHLDPVRQYSPRYIFLEATNFQLGRRLYYLFKRPGAEEIRETLPLKTNYREVFAVQQRAPVSDSLPYINSTGYGENLRSIAGTCRANGVKLIFVPNQSTWNSREDTGINSQHWLQTCGKIRYREEYLSNGLDSFNYKMREVAAETDVSFFDLPAVIPKTRQYFYDDCHFNVPGAREAGMKLAAFILDRKVLTDSVSTFQYK